MKFEKKYNEIIDEINKYQLKERPINWNYSKRLKYYKQESYLELYKSLICEDYTIFPVPRLLMNDMLDFTLYNNSLDKKIYTCKEILNEYILDWKYYNQFKDNINLMLKKNINCSITLILYDNINDVIKMFEEYKNEDVKDLFIEHFNKNKQLDKGIIYTYGNSFDVCLAINNSIKDKFIIAKTIQHELIHWMQVTLNSETGKNYGLFKNQKIILNKFDEEFLSDLGIDKNYLLNEYEFEPWVANTIEEFSQSKLTVDEYKEIIENRNLFIDFINNTKNLGEYEMYVFGMICYIASKRKYENYWYYLIEAMKEN